jgi:beta-lactamase class D
VGRRPDPPDGISRSTLWYYQELARRIGLERSRLFVERFAYGNTEIGGTVDTYWLHGPLMISPIEQTEFLTRLWRGELPVSQRSRGIVRELMLFDASSAGPAWRLYGKTGTARLDNGRFSTWLVGMVERDDATFAYAMRADMSPETYWMPTARKAKVKAMLQEVGVLPGDESSRRAAGSP